MHTRPALEALTDSINRKLDHPQSRIDLFNPLFADCPFGRYLLSPSYFGATRLLIFLTAKSS